MHACEFACVCLLNLESDWNKKKSVIRNNKYCTTTPAAMENGWTQTTSKCDSLKMFLNFFCIFWKMSWWIKVCGKWRCAIKYIFCMYLIAFSSVLFANGRTPVCWDDKGSFIFLTPTHIHAQIFFPACCISDQINWCWVSIKHGIMDVKVNEDDPMMGCMFNKAWTPGSHLPACKF